MLTCPGEPHIVARRRRGAGLPSRPELPVRHFLAGALTVYSLHPGSWRLTLLQVVRDGKSYITYIDLDVRIPPNPGRSKEPVKCLYTEQKTDAVFLASAENSKEAD
jgi:hypothetical protein